MSLRRTLAAAKQARRLFLQMDYGPRRAPADFSKAAVGVSWLVRCAYLFLAYEIATRLSFERVYRGEPTDLLWPVGLLEIAAGLEWMAERERLIGAVASAAGLLAMLFPGRLVFRLGVFIYLFFAVALDNSYAAINHGGHFPVYVGFALLFLPAGVDSPKRMARRDALTSIAAFWFAQSLILLPYTLAGFWKIYHSNLALLSTDGFVRILVSRAMEDTAAIPWLLPFFASQPLLAQCVFLGAVYLQFFALLALFRPALQRPFGLGLVLFHFGTDYLLDITFYPHVVYLGLFLVFSPFAQGRFTATAFVKSLPVFGLPLRVACAYRRTKPGADKAWLVYDGECYFCRHYARLLSVREAVGELTLVNARDGGPLVEEAQALRYDLDEGMALKVGGRWLFGSDALNTLALLSERRGVFGRANRLLFGAPRTARLAYPFLRLGRRALLRVRGVPPLDLDLP